MGSFCCVSDNFAVDNGEALKYDRHFKGPLSKRSCTDFLCLLLFTAFLCCWGFVGYYAVKHGDLNSFVVPTDSSDHRCGYDSEVIDKPNLLFFNVTECIFSHTSVTDCKSICVEHCPREPFEYRENYCNAFNITALKSKLICELEIDRNAIQTCEHITLLVNNKKCVRAYSSSDSYFKHCVSGVPISLQNVSQQLSPAVVHRKTRNVHNYIRMAKGASDVIPKNLLSHLANPRQTGELIIEDLTLTQKSLLLLLGEAMLCCLIIITLMRWVAGLMVWLSIFGVIALLSFFTYYTSNRFIELYETEQKKNESGSIALDLNNLNESMLEKSEPWAALAIVCAVFLLIILLVLLVLRKRILIAIALVKEGSKAVSCTPTTVFFPVFPWIFQTIVIFVGIGIGIYLASVGDPINRIVKLTEDTACRCTGLAVSFQNGDICDPNIFNKYCRQIDGNCRKAGCHLDGFTEPDFLIYYKIINVVGFFWVIFFIKAFGEMVLAATFATWYWTFHKSDVPFLTLLNGLHRTVRYHLGTLAFGSLIITIVRIIRVGLEYLSQKLKRSESQFAKFLLACLKCFFWLLETFLKFINRNAYIMCAIHGKPFCTSARDAFNLLMRNVLRVVALSKVTDFLFFMSKLLITLGMGARSSYYFNSEFKELHFPPVLIGLVMIGTYLIAMLFFSVYSMAIDTLFLCFLEDSERNDGSTDKPYYMSKQLMKILGKKNSFSRAEYYAR